MTDKEKPALQIPPSVFEQLAKDRILWLNKDVNDDNMAELAARMLALSNEDREKDIFLFINSPGGSITSGLMLYDMMQLIPNDVATVAVGMAASMGQFLLTMGAPGKRYVTEHARVLLHQPLGGFGGTASDIATQAKLIDTMKEQLAGLTASRTGKTVKQIHRDGDRDNWFTAQEAIEYGFADHKLKSITDLNITFTTEGNNKK